MRQEAVIATLPFVQAEYDQEAQADCQRCRNVRVAPRLLWVSDDPGIRVIRKLTYAPPAQSSANSIKVAEIMNSTVPIGSMAQTYCLNDMRG